MLIISGKSATGKDTIVHEMIKLGYKRIVTSTTRPMREGEIQDVTYHYLTTEDFLTKYNNDYFLEIKPYTTVEGMWYYGSALKDIKEADENTICILTPDGLEKLNKTGKEYTAFLIEVSDETIKSRQEHRGDNANGKKREEAVRRFENDKRDFKNIDHLYHYKINNENRNPYDVALEIDSLYRNGGGFYRNI